MKRIAFAFLIALASGACAHAQEISLKLTISNHRFQPAEIRAPAGRPIALTVVNADATPEEFESKDLRVERVIPGKSQSVFRLRPLQPGRYRFFGEFNEATAVGFLIVE